MAYHHVVRISSLMLVVLVLSNSVRTAEAGFVLAGEEGFGVDLVTHVMGYDGSVDVINITVGIDPTSAFVTEMQIPVQNVISIWNGLVPTTGNLQTANVPSGSFDFESVLLHEMGHALGLGHPNLASESGELGANQDYTKSTVGANNMFDLNPGADGVIGSADDLRGDDVNLNYFNRSTNDPFDTGLPGVIDSTTYSRDLADLPLGDNYAANAGRVVAAHLGYGDTESVMQQGQFDTEAQRTLAAEDVAHIRYAMSGLDEIQGTADDYIFMLQFAGETTLADIVLDFDNDQSFGFAATTFEVSSEIIANHIAITEASIAFNDGSGLLPFPIDDFTWFFNDVLIETPIPEVPGSVLLALCGVFGFGARHVRRHRGTKRELDKAV